MNPTSSSSLLSPYGAAETVTSEQLIVEFEVALQECRALSSPSACDKQEYRSQLENVYDKLRLADPAHSQYHLATIAHYYGASLHNENYAQERYYQLLAGCLDFARELSTMTDLALT
jgi:hypothetical protein